MPDLPQPVPYERTFDALYGLVVDEQTDEVARLRGADAAADWRLDVGIFQIELGSREAGFGDRDIGIAYRGRDLLGLDHLEVLEPVPSGPDADGWAELVGSDERVGTLEAAHGQQDLLWGAKMFEVTEIKFGSVAKGADSAVQVKVKNVYKEDIQITLENNVLRLSGERKLEKDVKKENYHRVERTYGTFSRAFALPQQVNGEGVHAGFENGVLTIMVPKAEQAKPRKISIS